MWKSQKAGFPHSHHDDGYEPRKQPDQDCKVCAPGLKRKLCPRLDGDAQFRKKPPSREALLSRKLGFSYWVLPTGFRAPPLRSAVAGSCLVGEVVVIVEIAIHASGQVPRLWDRRSGVRLAGRQRSRCARTACISVRTEPAEDACPISSRSRSYPAPALP